MSTDLVLDTQIRLWVFFPIFIITFLFGTLRYYISLLLIDQKKVDLNQLGSIHVIVRSRILRENNSYIPQNSFRVRRNFFTNNDSGYLAQSKIHGNIMADHNLVLNLLKGNAANVLPMIIIGGWVSWVFSGFVTTKAPFPLTLRFKPMVQKDIELSQLDPSWISSVSWYFFNVFGLRNIYILILGENIDTDKSKSRDAQILEMVANLPLDFNVIFKSEKEALELVQHRWTLTKIEYNL